MTRHCEFGDQVWEIRVKLVGKTKTWEAIAHTVTANGIDEGSSERIGASADEEAAFRAMIRRLQDKTGHPVGACKSVD